MRATIVILFFLPFTYYAWKDNAFHFKGRKVSKSEHLLHAAIGVSQVIMLSHSLLGHYSVVLGALLLFAVGGMIDDYIYHRDLPAEESDLHAKEHMALLVFVIVAFASDWLERNHWDVMRAFTNLRG